MRISSGDPDTDYRRRVMDWERKYVPTFPTEIIHSGGSGLGREAESPKFDENYGHGPNVVLALQERGFGEEAIKKALGGRQAGAVMATVEALRKLDETLGFNLPEGAEQIERKTPEGGKVPTRFSRDTGIYTYVDPETGEKTITNMYGYGLGQTGKSAYSYGQTEEGKKAKEALNKRLDVLLGGGTSSEQQEAMKEALLQRQEALIEESKSPTVQMDPKEMARVQREMEDIQNQIAGLYTQEVPEMPDMTQFTPTMPGLGQVIKPWAAESESVVDRLLKENIPDTLNSEAEIRNAITVMEQMGLPKERAEAEIVKRTRKQKPESELKKAPADQVPETRTMELRPGDQVPETRTMELRPGDQVPETRTMERRYAPPPIVGLGEPPAEPEVPARAAPQETAIGRTQQPMAPPPSATALETVGGLARGYNRGARERMEQVLSREAATVGNPFLSGRKSLENWQEVLGPVKEAVDTRHQDYTWDAISNRLEQKHGSAIANAVQEELSQSGEFIDPQTGIVKPEWLIELAAILAELGIPDAEIEIILGV